jgi:hypothetical protein
MSVNTNILIVAAKEIDHSLNRESLSTLQGQRANANSRMDCHKLQFWVLLGKVPSSLLGEGLATRVVSAWCIIPVLLAPDMIGVLLALRAADAGQCGGVNDASDASSKSSAEDVKSTLDGRLNDISLGILCLEGDGRGAMNDELTSLESLCQVTLRHGTKIT